MYVAYQMGNIAITIAFSNPPIGCNRLVFGGSKHAGEHVWGGRDGGKNTKGKYFVVNRVLTIKKKWKTKVSIVAGI